MAGSSVQVGVVQQRQEAGAVDRDRELALVAGLGAGDAGRDDLAVLVDEVLEQGDVLVVDLLDLLGGEAAELAAAEQAAVLAASVLAFGELAAFAASTYGGSGHGVFLSYRRVRRAPWLLQPACPPRPGRRSRCATSPPSSSGRGRSWPRPS